MKRLIHSRSDCGLLIIIFACLVFGAEIRQLLRRFLRPQALSTSRESYLRVVPKNLVPAFRARTQLVLAEEPSYAQIARRHRDQRSRKTKLERSAFSYPAAKPLLTIFGLEKKTKLERP